MNIIPNNGELSPMSTAAVASVVTRLVATLAEQRVAAAAVDSWLRPDSAEGFNVPPKAGPEHRALAGLARTPWLGLVVTNVAQAMYVDNVVAETGESPELWRLWLDNGMASHQIANHRAMVSYGQSFGVVTPATHNGVDSARMRCLSTKRMAVEWEDPATDVYPVYALEAMTERPDNTRWRLYAPGYIYNVQRGPTGASTDYVVTRVYAHGLQSTPVVRFSNQLDLDGNVVGEVAPFIPTAARINKTSYDRLLAQHFNSWKVRTATGLELPYDEENPGSPAEVEATERLKMRLAQEDFLMAEDPNVKFGVLDGTALDTYVTAWRSDIEALAAVSQTPAHALTGQLVNLNAEALAAARSPLTQKVWERQVNAGDTYSRMLRLAASMAGMDDYAADPLVRVTWQDLEIRSMSQAVDALGKAATMLQIPHRGLWARIPGVEASDVREWERLADEMAEADPLAAIVRRHNADTSTTGSPTMAVSTDVPAED